MKKLAQFAAAAVLLAATACSTPSNDAPDRPERPVSGGGAKRPAGGPVGGGGSSLRGQEWDQLIQRLKQQQEVSEQQRASQADEHYRLAERYFQTRDFDRAELECEKALQLNAEHASAKALWLEVQFILGRGQATPASQEFARIVDQITVQHQQTLLEIDNHMDNGVRAYNAGYYDEAERHLRTILEYAKWLPTGPDLETRRQKAADLLEQTKSARRQKEIDEQRVRLQMIEEERARDEIKRKIEEKRELEILWGQAQLAFERENYGTCIEICEKLLYRNPTLTSVEEMKMVSQRLRHHKSERDNLKAYVEEWKRTFENIEMAGLVAAEDLSFPARELWLEVIAKRQPKGIQDFDLEEMSPEDRQIAEKLKTIRFEIDMQNAGLDKVIEYVREISGLNFVIDKGIEDPTSLQFTFKAKDIYLDGALRLMLNQHKLAHDPQGGVVLITSQESLRKKVRLELYDVQDLTYGLQDFPGVDISLSEDSLGATATAEEGGKTVFDGTALENLIKETIEKGEWEGDGKSIVFQNGLLIVRNTVTAHKKIRKFLSDLRASSGILVSVEARFLTVEDNFLQQVGMDFRDVDGPRVQAFANGLNDLTPAFATLPGNQFAQFVDPDGPGGALTAQGTGISGVFGNAVTRNMGARVQHIMTNDILQQNFFTRVLAPFGGATLQYTLMDDISLEAIIRMVSRDQRQHVLTAPKLTLFNTQRGNIRISNQFAYIKDFDIQIAVGSVAPDPIPAVVSDGISLDVRPIVSADRRYITLEMRPTVAQLVPAPPNVFGISINLTGPGDAALAEAGTVFIETPVLNIQRLRTTVVVPDRGTLLLGGMTTLFDIDTESSIPIWRNIPILGNLGSNKVKGLQRRQLLTLVKARIIIPDEEEHRRFD